MIVYFGIIDFDYIVFYIIKKAYSIFKFMNLLLNRY